ncbi:Gti1/Pac2 family protein ASCRUDRAFT_77672 [Ascoidea rubescens DSM 1968]|uniref:Uncharacterized protein n=1 Tax=Ascoidea rubescens DSM 1968 TaxID=1344418 RepID=A0A1D2VAL8_9ASCO|nr:hypothetical protein ASCRUDRAFT_77672 [Ascoidea rubescens DSM 1968]ODV58660.1 hypothetical protein ASCRUDRAFT_77672 [Ascoidea rubescens DSM 1968]
MSATRISPTYIGYVGSTKDALLIIQATLNGNLSTVPRRPHDRERSSLIQSGNVFIFIEERSGIKRWTDGVAWSPSRILGRFLIYRELDRQALTDKDSKKIDKKKRRKSSVNSSPQINNSNTNNNTSANNNSQNNNQNNNQNTHTNNPNNNSSPSTAASTSSSNINNNPPANSWSSSNPPEVPNRSLVGSLVASYAFKEHGLIKKTLSLTISHPSPVPYQGRPETAPSTSETIHLVSYYSAEDVTAGKLTRPSDDPKLKVLQLSPELWNAVKESSLGGKIPIEDEAFYYLDHNNPASLSMGLANPNNNPNNPVSINAANAINAAQYNMIPQQVLPYQNPTNMVTAASFHNASFSLPPPLPHHMPLPPQQQQQAQQQALVQLQQQQSADSSAQSQNPQSIMPLYANQFPPQQYLNSARYYGQNPQQQQQQQQQQQSQSASNDSTNSNQNNQNNFNNFGSPAIQTQNSNQIKQEYNKVDSPLSMKSGTTASNPPNFYSLPTNAAGYYTTQQQAQQAQQQQTQQNSPYYNKPTQYSQPQFQNRYYPSQQIQPQQQQPQQQPQQQQNVVNNPNQSNSANSSGSPNGNSNPSISLDDGSNQQFMNPNYSNVLYPPH